MNGAVDTQEPDLTDRIGNALPADLQANYYREMRHLKSLPENDEMLRILRAMQFLTVLIHDAPLRTAVENEKLKKIFDEAFGTLQGALQSVKTQQAGMDQRLAQLPKAVAQGIKPEAIAAAVNESLRQEFLRSTIPETARALAATSAQIKKCQTEFAEVTRELNNSYTGALEQTRKTVTRLDSTCADAIQRAERMVASSKHVFDKGNRWTLYVLVAAAFVFGVGIDRGIQYILDSPSPPSVSTTEVSRPSPDKGASSKTPVARPQSKR